MTVLFRSTFPYDGQDDIPLTVDDLSDYTTVINGAGTAGALSLSTTRGAQSGSSLYVDSTSGDKFVVVTFTAGVDEFWMRAYIYNTQAPTATARVLRCRAGLGTNNVASVYLGTDNKFFISNGVSTTPLWTSTNAYLNKWVRLEWHVTAPAAGGGSQRLRIYSDTKLQSSDTDFTEQSTIVAADTFAGLNIQSMAFGFVNLTGTAKYYLDEMVTNDTGWPGPAVTLPTAQFTQTSLSGQAPLTITFTNNSLDADSYEWEFGDGSAISTETSPTHTYQRGGTYVVTLTAWAVNQSKSDIRQKTVTVSGGASTGLFTLIYDAGPVGALFSNTDFTTIGDPALATFTDQNTIKGPFALALDGRTGNTGLSYAISPAANQFFFRTYVTVTKAPTTGELLLAVARSANATVASVTVNAQGKWSLWRGIVGDYGNFVAESVSAIPHNVPIRVEWVIDPVVGGTGTQELRLFVGSNVHGTTADVTFSGKVTTDNVDQIRFGILQASGARAVLDSTSAGTTEFLGPVVSPNPFTGVPIAAFEASKLLAAKGDTLNFTGLATGSPTSYAWNFGDGGTSTATNPNHTYSAGGVYDVSLVATNASGASEPRTLELTILAPDRGQAVLKVWDNRDGTGNWNPVGATSTLLKIRNAGAWDQDVRPRVFKGGQWSSNEPITGTVIPPDQTGGGGWGPGVNSTGSWPGSSLGVTGTSDQDRYNKTRTLFSDISVIRTYDQNFPTNWAGTTGRNHLNMTGTEVIHYSPFVTASAMVDFKNNVTSTINSWQSRMDAFCLTIPNNIRIVLTVNHEPDKGGGAGRYDQEGFRIMQSMVQSAVDAARAARTDNKNWLKFATVIMGISFVNGTMGRWLIDGVDSWGMDPYYASSAKAGATYCNNHDKNFVIGEFAGHKQTVGGQPNDSAYRTELHNLWLEFYWRATPHKARTMAYWNAVDSVTGYSSVISPTNGYPLSSAYWTSVCETGYPPPAFWKP